MDGSFKPNYPFTSIEEDNDNPQETAPESPSSPTSNDLKLSPKKGKRSIQKRVVSVPIKDVEGSRLKGESSAPPFDSWAWRKYGQKPIKGSPYPRGYYRCSSSKGCPARKQVERSRVDPTMLVITYSCEHNHPFPASRNNSAAARHATAITTSEPTAATAVIKPEPSTPQLDTEPVPGRPEEKFADLAEDSILATTGGDEFAWFGEMETTLSTVLESPLFTDTSTEDGADVTIFFPMREEDESLFADLGELPECSVVFRHHRNNVGPEVGIC